MVTWCKMMLFCTGFIVFLTFVLPIEAFGKDLRDQKLKTLVELPLLDALGDSDVDESEVLNTEQKEESDSFDICDGFQSLVHFERKEDINQHPGFPLVPSTPTANDQLNTSFFKEISTQKFLVERWPRNHFPIAVFHLEASNHKYRDLVQKAVDYINLRSVEEGLTPKNEHLIELSEKTLTENQITCGSNMIHVKENQKYFSGYTISSIDYENPRRLGQILNKDIYINVPNSTMWSKSFFDQSTAQHAYIEQFHHEILHELLHGLGLAHNFALGSIMDYEGHSYSDRLNPGSKKLYREYDTSLKYEMETLKFLYGKLFQRSNVTWPLIRSTNVGTFYYVDEEPMEWGVNEEGQYNGLIDSDHSRVFCEDSKHQALELGPVLSKKINISFKLINEENVDLVPFGESSWVKVTIKNIMSSGSEIFENPVFAANILMRNLPALNYTNLKGKVMDSDTIHDQNIRKIILKRQSQFLGAFSGDTTSSLDTYFHVGQTGMFCHMQIQFQIQNHK